MLDAGAMFLCMGDEHSLRLMALFRPDRPGRRRLFLRVKRTAQLRAPSEFDPQQISGALTGASDPSGFYPSGIPAKRIPSQTRLVPARKTGLSLSGLLK